jgi:hypothetical protein
LKIAGHTGLTLSDFWHKVFLAMKMHAAIRRTSRTGIGRLAGVVIPAFLAFTCVGHAKPRLVPSLDTELVGTDSVVYCPTLQIAWDELKQIVGGPIKLSGDASKPIGFEYGLRRRGVWRTRTAPKVVKTPGFRFRQAVSSDNVEI